MILLLLFTFIHFIFTKLDSACSIGSGNVLLEYYKDQKDMNLLDNLHTGGINLKVQKMDCNSCDCPHFEGKTAFKVFHDKQEINSFSSYSEVLKFFNTDILDLKERDFYSPFEGPWLIHFYKDKSEEIDLHLKKVAESFGNTVRIGRINENESKNIIGRYNIKVFPVIMGIFNDLSFPFLEDLNSENLNKFVNKLIEHPLQNINHENLKTKIEANKQFYIVLYNNEKTANLLFYKYAHSFKFKLEIYKSNDPEIFQKVGLPNFNNEVGLAIYKNGKFHLYDHDIFDENLLIEWIFHTHFPNVMKISDSTFHTVFNGIKPVFLMLTTEDRLLPLFEKFGTKVHYGMPYMDLVFASLNLNEYMLFSQALLPKIEIPTFVIYNPMTRLWYHKKIILKSKTFENQAFEILKLYNSGKMKPYVKSEFNYFSYFLWISFILLLCIFIYANESFFKH